MCADACQRGVVWDGCSDFQCFYCHLAIITCDRFLWSSSRKVEPCKNISFPGQLCSVLLFLIPPPVCIVSLFCQPFIHFFSDTFSFFFFHPGVTFGNMLGKAVMVHPFFFPNLFMVFQLNSWHARKGRLPEKSLLGSYLRKNQAQYTTYTL